MTTAGDNITKANITEDAEAFKGYNSNIVWHSGNQPFQTDITGGNASGYATMSYAGDILDENVTASTLVNNFRSYATLLSRIRNVRLLKYYQRQGDPRAQTDYDATNVTNLNGNYAATFANTYDPAAGTNISASDLYAFTNYLSATIQANRTSTVTIEEFYCHSNCHGSCHGSI